MGLTKWSKYNIRQLTVKRKTKKFVTQQEIN